jgi:LPXTG-motif cell wall-anchored protein
MRSNYGRMKVGLVVAVPALFIICVASATAQVQTQQSTTVGKATKEVTVEKGEVVLVDGNDLIVKMEDGTILHFPNIPESARISVDGRQLGIHDLKPGMKLQRTITTTTTPQMVKTVQTVTGKVWYVAPPNTVTLTLENGENQTFKIPKGQKFMIDGQETDAFGLKKGMVVSATKIVEAPETAVAQHRQVTGTMPPPPSAPPSNAPILIATEKPAHAASAAPVETAAAPAKTLPKTGSNLPLVALLGLALVSVSLASRLLRSVLGS